MLTVIILIACLILIGSIQREENKFYTYAEETSQNTLLIFQKVPVKKLESISYTPNFPLNSLSTRKLKHKTLSKIIKEDVLLNPKFVIENQIITSETNEEFSKNLKKSIKKSLESLVGNKFDYRLKIRMKPTKIGENILIFYRKKTGTVSKNSQKICSRRIKLFFSIPQNWQQAEFVKDERLSKIEETSLRAESYKSEIFGENISNPNLSSGENMAPIFLTLELWSK